jgi:hypothetical protein
MKVRSFRGTKARAAKLLVTAAVLATAGGYGYAADMPVKAPAATPFFTVNDTSVSFTWYPSATDPGVPGGSDVVPGGVAGERNAFNKFVGTVTHFDVWKYGTNYFNLDFIQSDKRDPIEGVAGANGAVEVYGLSRSTLGFNELSGSKAFETVITKNVSFEWGGDANTENNGLAPEKKDIVVGLQFGLNLPGTVNFAVLAYKEWNHNNFLACGATTTGIPCPVAAFGAFTGDREFHLIPRLELQISEPLYFLKTQTPVTWNSFTGVNFPKGTGVSNANLLAMGGGAAVLANNETKTEVFTDNRLTFDMLRWGINKPGIWETYVGYRYWYNKFGTDHNAPLFSLIAPGTSIESTAYLGTTYHFK